MIDPKETPVDVEEVRDDANAYRESFDPPMSWKRFGEESGVPAGTLQPFCMGNYQAKDLQPVAQRVFRFLQTVRNKEATQSHIPTDPGYFETDTSRRILALLSLAHTGRMTLVATGPGTGKTMTVEHYAAMTAPVWCASMLPSSRTMPAMVRKVLIALGVKGSYGFSNSASEMVMEKIGRRKGLLVIDEAQHLTHEALEEIRGWHDDTKVGVCFLANEELLQRIRAGRQSDAFAKFFSRLGQTHEQMSPLKSDVEAFCDAWKIEDRPMRGFLRKIALTKGSGGLRECKQLIEQGSLFAAADGRGLTIDDLREAQSTRATKWIVA